MRWILCLMLVGCGGGGGEGETPEPDAGDAAIDLDSTAADAATDAAFAFDGRPITDAEQPDGPFDEVRQLYVTVNDIPLGMLGAAPGTYRDETRSFRWAVPQTGWTVDVHVVHPGGWTPPAEDPYLLLRSITNEAEPKQLEAGVVNVRGWRRSGHGHTWTAVVDEDISAGAGRYSIQTAVTEIVGELATFEIRPRPENTLPFPQTDNWLFTTDRDNSTISVRADGDDFIVETTMDANGVADLPEALTALGLLGENDAWNEALLDRVREEIRERCEAFYDDVDIAFHFDTDADLPEDQTGWSQLAIGGEDPRFTPGERAFFGRAEIDYLNQRPNDDTQPDLGIFTANFVRFVFANPITQVLARDIAPAAGGRPYGSVDGDLRFLEPNFEVESLPEAERARAGRFGVILEYLMLAMSSVVAHEVGHSVGLVKPGFPPDGMLAEVEGPWVEAPIAGAHIDTDGFNLMQSGTSFALGDAINGRVGFNAANLAYLRGRIIVLP